MLAHFKKVIQDLHMISARTSDVNVLLSKVIL